ncbi:MAG: class I SAM-dependent methyltransferase, partial [Gaiellaceae bacterium]
RPPRRRDRTSRLLVCANLSSIVEAGKHHWNEADLHAWQVLRPLLDAGPYLPWSEGAISPAGLATVCKEIALAGHRDLVELGSGVSTIVLARLLRERGGQLTSVEHHQGWASWVHDQIKRERLEHVARLIRAPLGPHPLAREGASWYEESALVALPVEGVELLMVDGPPAYLPGMEEGRYPALPALAGRLAPGALVVLDDADRPGERAILEAWERETAFRFDRLPVERIALGRQTR